MFSLYTFKGQLLAFVYPIFEIVMEHLPREMVHFNQELNGMSVCDVLSTLGYLDGDKCVKVFPHKIHEALKLKISNHTEVIVINVILFLILENLCLSFFLFFFFLLFNWLITYDR